MCAFYPPRVRLREWGLLLFAAVLLSTVAFLNGYPLVYGDTGTYLTQSLELEGAPDRPPYYALLIFPFHLGLSLWGVPLVQGALAAYLILKTVQVFAGARYEKVFVGSLAALLLCSSLPWFTSQIMPDIFTGMVVLNVFLLGFHRAIPKGERWFLILLLAAGVAVHFSHFAIALAALAALLLVSLFGPEGARVKRTALEVAGAVCVAFASFSLYNLALIKSPVLSAMSPIFFLARSLEDGPARQYLIDACPDPHFLLCRRLREIPPNSNEFLWETRSPLQDLYREKKWNETVEEARRIVRGAITSYPLWQLRQSAKNFLRQLTMMDTGDFDFDYRFANMKVTRAIAGHFPEELEQFLSSAQVQKTIPLGVIAPFHRTAALLAFACSAVLAALSWRRGCCRAPALFLSASFAFVVNAFMTGVLSAPTHRYGSRLAWLMPLILCVLAVQWLDLKKGNAKDGIS